MAIATADFFLDGVTEYGKKYDHVPVHLELEKTDARMFGYGNGTCVIITINGQSTAEDTRYNERLLPDGSNFRAWAAEFAKGYFNSALTITPFARHVVYDEAKDEWRYYDKNGVELHEGDIIRQGTGAENKLYKASTGRLGTDATNPAWIKSGRAVPCEYGIYMLCISDLEYAEKVK